MSDGEKQHELLPVAEEVQTYPAHYYTYSALLGARSLKLCDLSCVMTQDLYMLNSVVLTG